MAWDKTELRAFLKNQTAPEGFVYSWNADPFAQILLLPDEYTLFWRGTSELEDLTLATSAMVNDADSFLRKRTKHIAGEEWSIKLAFSEKKDPDQDKYEFSEELVRAHLTAQEVSAHVSERLRSRHLVCTYHVLMSSQDAIVNLWADSKISPTSHPDIGLTSNLPIAEPALDLFKKTSAFRSQIPIDQMDDLFFNEIAAFMKRFFET